MQFIRSDFSKKVHSGRAQFYMSCVAGIILNFPKKIFDDGGGRWRIVMLLKPNVPKKSPYFHRALQYCRGKKKSFLKPLKPENDH